MYAVWADRSNYGEWFSLITQSVHHVGDDALAGAPGQAGAINANGTSARFNTPLGIAADAAILSAIVFGACLGFLRHNLYPARIFMGDSGSLLLGFSLAALALGADYTLVNPLGVYAPLLILAVPMYDTFYVMAVRMKQGKSPFLGSRDHFDSFAHA